MILDRATPAEIHDVALAMRDSDFDEFRAVSWADDREALAHQLTDVYGERPDVLCARLKGAGPIAIGGALQLRPNVATLLFFATPEFGRIAVPMTRWIRSELFPRLGGAGVHRVEAVSSFANKPASRWLTLLGMRRETGPMVGYGKRGEAFVQWMRTLDAGFPVA